MDTPVDAAPITPAGGVQVQKHVPSLPELMVSYEFWLAAALFSGRSALSRFVFDISVEYSAAIAMLVVATVLAIACRRDGASRAVPVAARAVIAIFSLSFMGLLISLYWSRSPEYGANKLIGFALLSLYPIVLVSAVGVNVPRLAASFSLLAAILLVSAIAGISPGALVTSGVRFAAFGGGPNVFARFMAFGAISSHFSSRRTIRILWSAVLTAGAVLSQSRGAVLALACTYVVMHIDELRRMPRRAIAAVLVGILILWTAWAKLPTDYRDLLILRFSSITRDMPGGSAIHARAGVAIEAIEAIASRPMLGWGLGSFDALSVLRYPHNLVLEVLSECGLVLGTLILMPIAGAFLDCLSSGTHRQLWSGPQFYWFLFALMSAQFSGDIVDSRFVYFFAALAMLSPVRGVAKDSTRA
jgi:O-antigen ligase